MVQVHELRRVPEHVVRADAVVVVACNAAVRGRVGVEQIRRRREVARDLLGDIGPDRLLVVSRLEQRSVVELRERREVVLGPPGGATHAQVRFVGRGGAAEELALIILISRVNARDEGVVGRQLRGPRRRIVVVVVPRLRARQTWELADVLPGGVREVTDLLREVPLRLARAPALGRDDDYPRGSLRSVDR